MLTNERPRYTTTRFHSEITVVKNDTCGHDRKKMWLPIAHLRNPFRSTTMCSGVYARCFRFVYHFAPNAPPESCWCTNRIPWYHQNPLYTHRILFALTVWMYIKRTSKKSLISGARCVTGLEVLVGVGGSYQTKAVALLWLGESRAINDCARKRPLAEGWSLGPARREPHLKRHSIDFRNSIKSIIFHKLNHASARNMYQNINFMNSNWSVIHHNVYKLSSTFTYIQSKTYPLHFRMFTEYPQNFLKGAI